MPFHGKKRRRQTTQPADDDDLLIDYLERKLGMKGDKQKASEVLEDVAKVEFGGEKELFDILDTVLEGRPSNRAYTESGNDSEETNSGSEESREAPIVPTSAKRVRFAAKLPTRYSTTDESSACDVEEVLPIAEEPIGEALEEYSIQETDSDASEEDVQEIVDEEGDSQDGDGEGSRAPDTTPAAGSGKYVPPHLRKAAAQAKSTLGMSDLLAHTIRSTFNRVGEGNLNVMVETVVKAVIAEKSDRQNEVLGAKSDEDVQELIANFMDAVYEYCAEQSAQILKVTSGVSLLAPQIALLCALALSLGRSVLHQFLAKSLPMFESARKAPPAPEDSVGDANRDCARQCVNAFSLLAFFGFIEPELVVAFGQHIALASDASDAFSLELLAILYRIYGTALKAENREAYRSLKTIIEHLLKQQEGVQNMQMDWVRLELSSGEKKTPLSEKLQAMRVWLRRKASMSGVNGVVECYDAAGCLTALIQGTMPEEFVKSDALVQNIAAAPTKEERQHQGILDLARRNRIKSPLQQRVFVAIMASGGPTEACEKLLGCMHNNKDIEPAISMLYFCLLKEKSYNPFYAQLASKLCNVADVKWQHKLRHGVRSGMFTAVRSLRANDRWTKQRPKLMAFMGEISSDLDEKDSTKMWNLLNDV